MISRSDNPTRKYPHTLEMVKSGHVWVGVNTSLTNKLVREALEHGIVKEFNILDSIIQEVKTSANTRLDFQMNSAGQQIYMEVKNCSLAVDRAAMFPDAITSRGTKHLHELAALIQRGNMTAVFFCIQRGDVDYFRPARHIDPLYAKTLVDVAAAGVLVLAYQAEVTPDGITITRKLPVMLDTENV
jgi:sugar fermentation stimulation protein A